jgi:diguanylate cyclase (GGDEF)-like protein
MIGLCPLGAFAGGLKLDYRCDGTEAFNATYLKSGGWIAASNGKIPIEAAGVFCWLRIDEHVGAIGFSDLNVQRVDIALFDASGNSLGHAKRLGPSDNAIVSGTQAVFPLQTNVQYPLYGVFAPIAGTIAIPGLERNLVVESLDAPKFMREGQAEDLLNVSGAVFLFTTAIISLFFGIALREVDFGIYALYATLQAITIFTKSGLAFVFDAQSPLWLNALVFNYLVGVLSVLLSVRFGRFALHSPRTVWVAYGVAITFLLVIPLTYLSPKFGSAIVFALVPLHFLTLLSGNWRGWRFGERGCGILLLGLTPIAAYWTFFVLYNVVLQRALPSAIALGSNFDFFRTLFLPAAFCYGLADRTFRLQRESIRLARFDALTDLRNREGIRKVGQELIDAGKHPCTLMLNIERFHAINETLGPALGDSILRETGRRLSEICKVHPDAVVGRMHADQFCILFPTGELLPMLRAAVEQEFSHPAEVDSQAVDIALAVGVAIPGAQEIIMSQLLRNAEIALDAGRSLRKHWLEYRVDLESSHRADLDLLSELKRAVEQGELRVFLQPKVRLADGVVASAEALVRWMHPRRGLVPPGEFVPFAEKTGRITLLTRWILEEVMRYVTNRRAEGRPIQISVNLSTFDLAEAGFAQRVDELAKLTGVDPSDIRLEITESGAMDDPAAALEVMNDLRNAGFSLSIDDFGTGYSSLAYLQKMPVAELKIDRAFVKDVHAGSDGASLLDSTIALGHRLGLSVVAEGAENAQEWALLKSLGCDYAQGWHAAKPMPIPDFEIWCDTKSPFISELHSS